MYILNLKNTYPFCKETCFSKFKTHKSINPKGGGIYNQVALTYETAEKNIKN